MSLHELAHSVQKAGRGEDTVLIHMTPKEVNGLQSLAMAHGGSLTINPETGLPEAGFLKSLLPTLIGVGLTVASGGALSPLMAAAITGAGYGLATGSLEKGLMAGLGAYGGAGLGAGLSSVGAGAAGAGAGAGAANAITGTAPNLGGSLMAGATGTTSVAPSVLGSGFYNTAPSLVPTQLTAAKQIIPMSSNFGNMGAGLKTLNSTAGFSNLYDALPKYTIPALAGTALAGMQKDYKPPKQNLGMIRPYEFNRTQNQEAYDQGNPIYAEDPGSSRERNYFTDQYTALTPYEAPGPEYKNAAGGGLMGLNAFNVGGPVEEMSAMNALSGNPMYPQSQLQTPAYSNPMIQNPVASNVINGGIDTPVDAFSGEQRMAEGGKTTGEYKYDYNPQTQQFTQLSAPISVVKDKRRSLSGPFSAAFQLAQHSEASKQTQQAQQAQQAQQPKVTGGLAQAPQMQQQQQSPYQMQQTAPLPEYQTPEQQLGMGNFYKDLNAQMAGMQFADGGMAGGGYNLGGYSDGGRLLRGPGDGVSDSIPASIGGRQPARLADGEFVVPARIVSEIGNGSTEAGARKLYAMMDRVQKARKKTVGKNQVAANTRTEKLLPA